MLESVYSIFYLVEVPFLNWISQFTTDCTPLTSTSSLVLSWKRIGFYLGNIWNGLLQSQFNLWSNKVWVDVWSSPLGKLSSLPAFETHKHCWVTYTAFLYLWLSSRIVHTATSDASLSHAQTSYQRFFGHITVTQQPRLYRTLLKSNSRLPCLALKRMWERAPSENFLFCCLSKLFNQYHHLKYSLDNLNVCMYVCMQFNSLKGDAASMGGPDFCSMALVLLPNVTWVYLLATALFRSII